MRTGEGSLLPPCPCLIAGFPGLLAAPVEGDAFGADGALTDGGVFTGGRAPPGDGTGFFALASVGFVTEAGDAPLLLGGSAAPLAAADLLLGAGDPDAAGCLVAADLLLGAGDPDAAGCLAAADLLLGAGDAEAAGCTTEAGDADPFVAAAFFSLDFLRLLRA